MHTFTAEDKPGDIVKVFPKASDLFKHRRIDFCCNGDHPLTEVFANDGHDEQTVLDELNHAYTEWKQADHELIDWDAMGYDELVDHIVHKHHAYLNTELGALGEFVTKIFRVHGASHNHLKELHRLYNAFKTEMEEHMVLEENEVFPLIKKYGSNPSTALLEQIVEANGGLEDDHQEAGDLLKQMRIITDDFTPPESACNSYRITYSRLKEMESDTFQHVHLENNILFKNLAKDQEI